MEDREVTSRTAKPEPPRRENDMLRVVPVLHAVAALALAVWLSVVVLWPWLAEAVFSNEFAGSVEALCREYFCHRKPQRSLAWGGVPLLTCARCTGVIAGYAAGAVAALCGAEKLPLWRVPWALLFIALMGLSWLAGWLGIFDASWHAERVVAGMLGGLGGYIFIARCVVLLIDWVQRRQLQRLEGATA